MFPDKFLPAFAPDWGRVELVACNILAKAQRSIQPMILLLSSLLLSFTVSGMSGLFILLQFLFYLEFFLHKTWLGVGERVSVWCSYMVVEMKLREFMAGKRRQGSPSINIEKNIQYYALGCKNHRIYTCLGFFAQNYGNYMNDTFLTKWKLCKYNVDTHTFILLWYKCCVQLWRLITIATINCDSRHRLIRLWRLIPTEYFKWFLY